jgi:hypothetical protein
MTDNSLKERNILVEIQRVFGLKHEMILPTVVDIVCRPWREQVTRLFTKARQE